MAETIKGINVVIGADTTALSAALSDVNKKGKDIQSELKQVEKLLKLDPKNTELLAQKQKLLADAVANAKEKLDRLKAAQEQVNEQFKKGEISEGQYRAFQREIAATEQSLKSFENQASKTKKSLVELGNSLKTAGDKMTGIGKTMSIGVTAPIIAAGGAAVKFASDMAESTNKVNVAFGKSADEVKTWADTTLKSYGIAEGTALDMAALFGDMGTAMGQSQEEAAKMSMSLVGLAGDLASFKNIGLEQAQDALKGIFTGEGEALKTLGIVMQDSTLEAYALSTGQKKAYSEMTQAEKVALRYSFVMDAAKNAQGDFARTSDGTANQLRIMQESIKELAASIGEVLLPIITPIVTRINEWLKGFAGLDEGTKKIIVTIAGIAAALGPLLIIVGSLAGAISSLIGFFTVGATGVSAFGAAIAVITGPIGIAIVAIAALAAAAYLIYKNWDLIKAFFTNLWEGIKNVFQTACNAIVGFLQQWGPLILAAITGPIGLIIYAVVKHWDDIKAKTTEIWNAIKDFVANAFKWLYDHNYYFKDLVDAISKAWNTLKSATEQVWNTLKSWLQGIWQGISGTASSVWNGIYGTLSGIASRISDTIQGAWNAIASATGNVWGRVSGTISGIASSIWNSLSGLASRAWSWGSNLMSEFIDGVKARISDMMQTMRDVAARVANFLGFHSPAKEGPGSDADKWAPNLIKMYVAGIRAGIPDIMSAVSSVASSLGNLQANVTANISSGAPAVAAAGSSPIVIQNMTVRNDQDIERIAQRLYQLQQGRLRGQGK